MENQESYENWEEARRSIILLGRTLNEEHSAPSMEEFTDVRNYLITIIALENAHRSNVFINMTMKDFKEAKNDNNQNLFISVGNRKNMRGPAIVFVPERIINIMHTFIQNFRPKSAGADDGYVFTTFKGEKLQSSLTVFKQINELRKSRVVNENCVDEVQAAGYRFESDEQHYQLL